MTPLNTVTTRRELLELLPKGGVYAEIGVFAGEFSREILEVTKPGLLYLCDIWSGRHGSGDKDGHNYVKLDLTNFDLLLSRSLGSTVAVRKMPSYEFLQSLKNNTLDGIYIDASHKYEAVSRELALARTKVKKGGWILGHDYTCTDGTWDFSGVRRAVDDFIQLEKLNLDYIAEDNCQSFAIQNL